MTVLERKPWSDEEDASAAPMTVASSIAPAPDGLARGRRWRTHASSVRRFDWIYRPESILSMLAVAAILSAWVGIFDREVIPTRVWLFHWAILALAGGAGGVLWHGRQSRELGSQQLLDALEMGLTRATPVDTARLSDECLGVIQRVQHYVEDLRSSAQSAQSREQRLLLERTVCERERRAIEHILENVGEAILVTDDFDRVTVANRAARGALGLRDGQYLRKPLDTLVADEVFLRHVRQCREAGAATSRRNAEHTIGQRVFSLSLQCIDLQPGDADAAAGGHGVVTVMRDITREREVSRAKSDFVAKAAHELRTPLSSIKAYVEMLVDGEAADEKTRREYYEIIQAAGDRLGRLIDNMLNISRIESGTVRVNKEPINLAVVVKEALDVARPQAEAKSIRMVDELTPVYYQVMADRDMINQIFLNLLSNAIKYTPEGGAVTVRMLVDEERHTVTTAVSDTGVGIPEEDLPRVFEKFFRVKANSKMAIGTGLGLNLVKHLVETVHGGRITLTSKVGHGSTFSVVLPLIASGSALTTGATS